MTTRGDNVGSYSASDVSSLGRDKINAIYAVHGENTILKMYNSKAHNTLPIAYFLQKFGQPDFDIFMGIRNSKLWGTSSGHCVQPDSNYHYHMGIDTSPCNSSPCNSMDESMSNGPYNVESHTITDAYKHMCWWDEWVTTSLSGTLYTASR